MSRRVLNQTVLVPLEHLQVDFVDLILRLQLNIALYVWHAVVAQHRLPAQTFLVYELAKM